MYIKFSSDGRERVVECGEYSLYHCEFDGQQAKRISPDDTQEGILLFDQEGHWKVAFIMNAAGQTIETVYAFPSSEK